jgi:hypothetical protein
VQGCTYTNTGFDGASYQALWPDGSGDHPTPFQVSSPKTGSNYSSQYAQVGFETDLPATEGTCDTNSGAGCTLIPTTDQGVPANFYPFYTTTNTGAGCVWQFGNDLPGETSDFGQNSQYGTLLQLSYTNPGGSASSSYEDFRQVVNNPCP